MGAKRVTGGRRGGLRADERAAVAARVAAVVGPGAAHGAAVETDVGAAPASSPGPGGPELGGPELGGPELGGQELVGQDSDGRGLGGWVPPEVSPAPRQATGVDTADAPDDEPTSSLGVFPDDLAPARRPLRERWRIDPGRRGVLAVAAVVVVVGSVAGGVVAGEGSSSPDLTIGAVATAASAEASASSVPSAASPAGAPGTASVAPSSGATTVTVDVTGRVTRPGVVRLSAGARVEDALAAAGGPLPGTDLSGLNRARVLVDGEQVAVGVPGAAPAPAGSAAASAVPGVTGAAGLVDLNRADLSRLEDLPGVGPVLGQAILDWRTEHGRFTAVDQLQDVTGIGPSRFAQLRDLVTV